MVPLAQSYVTTALSFQTPIFAQSTSSGPNAAVPSTILLPVTEGNEPPVRRSAKLPPATRLSSTVPPALSWSGMKIGAVGQSSRR
jgi:hypothetical protein